MTECTCEEVRGRGGAVRVAILCRATRTGGAKELLGVALRSDEPGVGGGSIAPRRATGRCRPGLCAGRPGSLGRDRDG